MKVRGRQGGTSAVAEGVAHVQGRRNGQGGTGGPPLQDRGTATGSNGQLNDR